MLPEFILETGAACLNTLACGWLDYALGEGACVDLLAAWDWSSQPIAGVVDWIRPVRKTFRTRVLCARRDPRALLIFSVVYTGYATRRVKLSGFRDSAPTISF